MMDLKHLPNAVPDEKVMHVLRRHPITLFWFYCGLVFMAVAPFAIWGLLSYTQPALLEDQATLTLIILGGSSFFLFAWLFMFQNFLDYLLDAWIVTTKRVLNIEQTGLFSRTVSELRLFRVQDVTSTIKGFIPTMFDYGNMEIQTAGEKIRFVFEQIPHPTHISKSVLELAEADRKEHLEETVEQFGMPDKPNTQTK